MKKYSSADLPLQTSNAILAFCLYISGIPFSDPEQPLINIYDADYLRSLGYSGSIEESAHRAITENKKGLVEYGFQRTVELGYHLMAFDEYQKAQERSTEAAKEIVVSIALRFAGGQLSQGQAMCAAACVIIKRWRDELKGWEIVRAFGQRQQKNKTGVYDAREVAEMTFLSGDFYEFAAVLIDARSVFIGIWRKMPPTIRLRKKGRTKRLEAPVDGKRIKFPGFVIYNTNATQETRREIGAETL